MKRTSVLIAASFTLLVLFFTGVALAATHTANDSVQQNRLPFLTGTGQVLTQGWGGTYSHYGTYTYHGTDWAPAGGGTFRIYAVSESQGDATCALDGTWGYRVRADRINSPYFDRYAHLPACPFSSKHLEQGDSISDAGCTGTCDGTHLHFQVENSSGATVSYCLSNFCSFADSTYRNDTFVSDNAGPGVNAANNATVLSKIRTAYVNNGHYLCGGEAWDCFGSSKNMLGEGQRATRSCLGSPSDCGWHQDFLQDKWHDFNWPEACSNAYWIPDQFFLAYLNNTWLGQARSSVAWNSFLGGYVQYFRYGMMVAPTFGGTPTVYGGPTTSCLA